MNTPMKTRTPLKNLGSFTLFAFATVVLGGCINSCSTTPKVGPGTTTAEPAKTEHLKDAVTIVFQSGRQGVIEPCGCKVTPNGGMDREYNLIQEYRADGGPVYYVDGGDTYAPVTPAEGMTTKLYQQRGDAITEMQNIMGLDVYNPGPGDALLGKAFLDKQKAASKAKWISTNLVDKNGKHVFSPMEVMDKGGVKIAFLGILTPAVKLKDGLKALDPNKALKTWLPKAAAAADYVVLLSQMGSAKKDAVLLKDFPKIGLLIGNDPNINRQDPFQPTPGQIALDPHNQGFMAGVMQFQHKGPFKGWFSKAVDDRLQAEIKGYTEALEFHPPGTKEHKSTLDRIEQVKKEVIPNVEGSTPYTSRLVGLDEKRYGKANEITPKVDAEKKRVARAAIDAPAE